MKKSKYEIKRKGFTLVELLIVIVVIGVLSAMMMLSSTEAVSSAKASDIISDLRNLKTAALAYYVDHLDAVDNPSQAVNGYTFTNINAQSADILQYMGNTPSDSNYTFSASGIGVGTWFVGHTKVDPKVGEKLKNRAKAVGLYSTTTSSADSNYYQGGTSVYMFIR